MRLHDLDGEPLGYCGRRLEEADIRRWGKRRFPLAFPKAQVLFNAHRAQTYRQAGIVVVECPRAVMRVAQAGCDGVVALLGTALSTVALAWLSHAAAVLLMLDGDSAGRQAAEKVECTPAPLTSVRRCRLPLDSEPEDVCELELRRIIRKILPAYSL